jgi:hypothetical protein
MSQIPAELQNHMASERLTAIAQAATELSESWFMASDPTLSTTTMIAMRRSLSYRRMFAMAVLVEAGATGALDGATTQHLHNLVRDGITTLKVCANDYAACLRGEYGDFIEETHPDIGSAREAAEQCHAVVADLYVALAAPSASPAPPSTSGGLTR